MMIQFNISSVQGQLLFELAGSLEGFRFFQAGIATKSIYSTFTCPICRHRILPREVDNLEVWSGITYNPLLILPFPMNGATLSQIIEEEFVTEADIPYNCEGRGSCGAKNIGKKSKTNMLMECPYFILVSVTRRIMGTQDRIGDLLSLGETSVTINANTEHKKTFQLIGSLKVWFI